MKRDKRRQCEGNRMGRDKEREKVDSLVAKENGNGKDKSEEIMSACQNRLIGTC